ncbi:MAG: hypothetical protein OXL41_13785 [Nitrospinae bacterium]|nr:hypothetical protein [Nitrospinota bacterium]
MGSPACVIVSRGFSHSGRAIARRQGYGGLPIVEMDHPLAAPARETLKPKADAVVAEVVHALTGDARVLRAEFAEKKFRGPENLCPK